MNRLKNLRIAYKIGGGFAVVLALLVGLAGFGIFSMNGVGGLFTGFGRIAATAAAVGEIQANLLDAQLAAKHYMQTGSDEAERRVGERGRAAMELGRSATDAAESPEDIQLLQQIGAQVDAYLEAFDEIVALRGIRIREVQTLTTLGPQIEKTLSDIMQSAYSEGNLESTYYGSVALRNILLVQLHATRYLVDNDEAARDGVLQELGNFTTNMEFVIGGLADAGRREAALTMLDQVDSYSAAFEAAHKAIVSRNGIVSERLDVIGPEVSGDVGILQHSAKARESELGTAAGEKIELATMLTAALGVVAVLIGAAAAFAISRGISRPVDAMTRVMQRLAEKDMDVEVPATGQRDEIGEMAQAVLVFKENMVRADALAAGQEKEQRERQARAERIEALNRQFDSSVGAVLEAVGTAVGELQTTAKSMSSIAEETSAQANAVAAASEQSSTSVHTVSSSAEELSSSIQEIARQIAHSSALTGEASNRAAETQEVVSGLSSSVDKIGDIVRLITDIAEQTNLLALNATIEAARAGEAGKGFAVVATEVKNLATQTARATDEISRQIGAVQAETRRAVPAIDEIAKAIEEVDQVASSIASAVEEQSAATGEIAQNVQQVAAGSSEISENISGMSRASGEANGAAGDVLASTERLSGQAAQLRELVDTFIGEVRAA